MSITTEISKNVFLTTKKMETNSSDGCHTIYLYTVTISYLLLSLKYSNYSLITILKVDVKEVSIVEVTLDFSDGFNI